MAKVKISVIISTYNRKNLLKKCLRTLFAQTYPEEKFETIVVDDGSTDTTASFIKTLQKQNPNLRYLRQPHGGVIRARNLGIKNARGEIVVFSDDDCLPKKNWLEQIEKAFKKNLLALGVEGKTLTFPAKVTPFTAQIVNTKGGGYQTCNIAYKKRILERVGGFDEMFLFPHCEDLDLALRVAKLGPICFAPKAVVIHPPRPTTFKQAFDRLQYLIPEFYFFLKHPDYFQEKYGQKNVFFQIVFVNSIWIRLFHLKFYSSWIRKNLFVYLKFFLRTILEIGLIIALVPKFWPSFKKLKGSFGQ